MNLEPIFDSLSSLLTADFSTYLKSSEAASYNPPTSQPSSSQPLISQLTHRILHYISLPYLNLTHLILHHLSLPHLSFTQLILHHPSLPHLSLTHLTLHYLSLSQLNILKGISLNLRKELNLRWMILMLVWEGYSLMI